jgi:hypothetical protein
VPLLKAFPILALVAALAPVSPAIAAAAAPPPRLDLSRLSSRFDDGQVLRRQGVARTSLEHGLQGGAAHASLGFLCGLQPQGRTAGGAAAYGVDHDGRFLGAQLRVGFR